MAEMIATEISKNMQEDICKRPQRNARPNS